MIVNDNIEVCAAADCNQPRPPQRTQGPRAIHCSSTCRHTERRRRDKEAGKTYYVPRERKPRALKYQPGDRFGQLVLVEHLGKSETGQPMARFACDCGAVCEKHLYNITRGYTTTCAGSHHRRGESITYSTAHGRVRTDRGPAKDHSCFFCLGPALDWAYFHAASDAMTELDGKEKGRIFSADPAAYVPVCRGCHIRLDRAHDRLGYGARPSLVHRAVLDLASAG